MPSISQFLIYSSLNSVSIREYPAWKLLFNTNYKIKEVIDVLSRDHQIHSCILSADNVGSTAADKWLQVTKACHREKVPLTGRSNCPAALALTVFLKTWHLWWRITLRADIDDKQMTNKQMQILIIKKQKASQTDRASGWKHCPKLD